MIQKKVTQIGSLVIRSKADLVRDINSPRTQGIIKDLVDSMRFHNLVGMAAPQINQSDRIFVTEVRKTKNRKSVKSTDQLRIFINPKVVSATKKQEDGYEGCGSVAHAGLFGKVRRSASVTVQAWNEIGDVFKIKTTGLLARVIQHEMDHLDGKVFLDRMTDMRSLMTQNHYLRLAK